MPGCIQYESDQSQRHGRARKGPDRRQGRQVSLACRVTQRFPDDPLVGILLAAGSASRFGGGKLLAPLEDGTPLGVRALINLAPCVDSVVVVVRPDDAP